MFCLYQAQDAGRRLSPRDFQFVQTPRVAFDNARIHYEMDYRRYERQDVSGDLPQRKSANNDRFNPSNKYSGHSGYDPIYEATERSLKWGRIIGIDTSQRWDPFYHPFYFDAESNLVYDGSRDLRDSPFEQAVRRAYEQCLKRHHGKKPAPTLKKHYIGDSGQQAPPGKMLNSKAAGRLLAAGGVYNSNVAGFRKTAEQLGGDAVEGYDQVLNEKTSGSMIAAASVLLAKTARTPLTRGELNSHHINNKNIPRNRPSKSLLSKSAASPNRNGLTDAGRALQKHGGREGSAYSYSSQKSAILNQEGQAIVNEILSNPNSKIEYRVVYENKQKITVLEVTAPDGRALRYNADGTKLIGLREPPTK